MIRLADKKTNRVTHFLGVLESRVAAYIAVGWRAHASERRASLDEKIILLVWDGDDIVLPESHGVPR